MDETDLIETRRILAARLPETPRIIVGSNDYGALVYADCRLADGRRIYVPAETGPPPAEIAEALARRVRAIVETDRDPAPLALPPPDSGPGVGLYVAKVWHPDGMVAHV
jgi:hypothetical protein